MSELSDEIKYVLDTYGENPHDWTRLHEDLQPFYEARGGKMGWPMLRHPLVYQIPFFSWKLANDAYEYKKKKVVALTQAGKWDTACFMYERPYRLDIAYEWMQDGIDIREFFPEVWRDTELPDSVLAKPKYREMFLELGFLTDVKGLRFEDLPGQVTVYRGSLPRWRRGLAWSRDIAIARFFAKRGDAGCKVWQATVPRSAILAWFDDRGEQEVVLHPRKIREVRECTS